MKRFVEGVDRGQSTLFPECLDDWIDADNPVRVIDVFVEKLDLGALDFGGVDPKATGRPSYHPSVLLKLYVYGYLNRVQSSRRLEREAGRNVEVMWLTGRRVPDHKTIADFRKDNGLGIRQVCSRFVVLCRTMGLFVEAGVAIDGSISRQSIIGTRISRAPNCSGEWGRSRRASRAICTNSIAQTGRSLRWRARRSPLASKRSSQSWKKRCSG